MPEEIARNLYELRTPSPRLRHVVAALELAYRSTMARMLL